MTAIFRSGNTALITGGASGIGYAFARHCKNAGMNIALIDNNPSYLSGALAALTTTPSAGKTKTYNMDVSSITEWQKLKSSIDKDFDGKKIDILMLNAGTAVKAKEGSTPWTDLDHHSKTYAVNIFGVLNAIATFLPTLQSRQEKSTIIITGSKQGITNPPGSVPAYNASKATIKHLSEHLAHDMRSASPQIGVHLLVPGWVYTGFSGNGGPIDDKEAEGRKPKGAWLGSRLVEYAVKKIDEGKFYIVCPDDDASEAMDQARMMWQVGDVVEGRSALSRWDPEWKDEAAEWIRDEAERREKA